MNQHATLTASNNRAGRRKESEIVSRDFQLPDVAACLFMNIGYHQVSINRIVRAAGVAGRTIYSRYGGKAGLLEAVIDRELTRQRACLDSLIERDDNDDAIFVALAVRCWKAVCRRMHCFCTAIH